MICAEFKELAMDYALGVLDEAERMACDAHLRETAHEGCLEALRKATAAVALIPSALEQVAPGARTWAGIEREIERSIGAATAMSDVRQSGPAPARARRRWRAQAGWMIAAAAIVIVLALLRDRDRLVAIATSEQAQRAQCVAELEQQGGDARLRQEAIAMLQRPGTRLVALAAQGDTPPANLIYRLDETRVFVVGNGLRAPAGKALQLWAVRGEQQIAEGLLRGDSSGAVHTGEIAAIRDGHLDAFGITIEPSGGASGTHGPVLLYGKI